MEIFKHLFENALVRAGLFLALLIIVIRAAVVFSRRLIRSRIEDSRSRYTISKVIGFAGYALFLIVAVSLMAGRLTGFSLAVGAASAGVAFALQSVIVSFAGWLTVLIGNYYAVGDRIRLGGIRGDVIDIGFLRTTLMECGDWVNADLYNGRIVRVPNSFALSEPVFNYSGEFSFLWDEIVVPIKYGSDYELARQMMEDAAKAVSTPLVEAARAKWQRLTREYRLEEARLEPLVTLVFNSNWAEFTVRYLVDYRKRRTTMDALSAAILKAIEASKTVAVASTTLQIQGGSTPPIDPGATAPAAR